MMKVEIDVGEIPRRTQERLDLLALTADGGAEARRQCALSLAELVRGTLTRAAASRHKTAGRLGAEPTRRLETAAGRVEGEATDAGCRVTVRGCPGLSRAYRDLEIRPVRRRALTIPVDALVYGRDAAWAAARYGGLFRPLPKGGREGGERRNVLMAVVDGAPRALFALVRRAVVPRDPGLLPQPDACARILRLTITKLAEQGHV